MELVKYKSQPKTVLFSLGIPLLKDLIFVEKWTIGTRDGPHAITSSLKRQSVIYIPSLWLSGTGHIAHMTYDFGKIGELEKKSDEKKAAAADVKTIEEKINNLKGQALYLLKTYL
jgi:hypothetical protein